MPESNTLFLVGTGLVTVYVALRSGHRACCIGKKVLYKLYAPLVAPVPRTVAAEAHRISRRVATQSRVVRKGPVKKPVKRVSLLEDLLSKFIEVEDILLKLELTNELQPLSEKQKQLHKEIVERVTELVRDLSNDVEGEHRVA